MKTVLIALLAICALLVGAVYFRHLHEVVEAQRQRAAAEQLRAKRWAEYQEATINEVWERGRIAQFCAKSGRPDVKSCVQRGSPALDYWLRQRDQADQNLTEGK